MKRLAALLTVAAASATMALAAASPAAAAPAIGCTTTSYSVPDLNGGVHHASYVGSYWTLSATIRVWHYTSQYGSVTHYTGASGVRCNSANEALSYVDLTKETLTASDHPKCGTTSYTVGDDSYNYIASRYNEGDKFRYWSHTIQSGFVLIRGVSAVRCN